MQEAKEEGIRQGIWLCIQRLVHMEQYDMAKYFIKLSNYIQPYTTNILNYFYI